jgi:hypothetical protein
MTTTRRKREIESHNVFLVDMMKDVKKGLMLPAAFQRQYVWTKADVLQLIKSILEGYPIGSFLVWSPWGAADVSQAGRHRIGPIVGAHDIGNAIPSFLLDGQNRLTTMAWLTRNPDDPLPADLSGQELETWGSGEQLVLDLREQRIHFVPDNEVNVGFRLPISALFHGNLNREMRGREDTQWVGIPISDIDNASKWIDDVRDAFMGARIVVTDIRYATFEEALDAFLHICKLGVPMTKKDFKAALSWAVVKKPTRKSASK